MYYSYLSISLPTRFLAWGQPRGVMLTTPSLMWNAHVNSLPGRWNRLGMQLDKGCVMGTRHVFGLYHDCLTLVNRTWHSESLRCEPSLLYRYIILLRWSYTHTPTRIQTCTHTHSYTHTHAHTHAHMHTHSLVLVEAPPQLFVPFCTICLIYHIEKSAGSLAFQSTQELSWQVG